MSEGHAGACRRASEYRLFVLREAQTHGARAYVPRLARPLAGIVNRLSDLLPVVRDGLYHPGFEFSNSIKSVAPERGATTLLLWLDAQLVLSAAFQAQGVSSPRRLLGQLCRQNSPTFRALVASCE
jgi:hypothetical protein